MQKQLFSCFNRFMGMWWWSFISPGKNNFTGLFGFLKGLDRGYSLVQLFTDVGFLFGSDFLVLLLDIGKKSRS
ncbi:MAG: hypothetical protein ABI358_05060 [Ginsengibacter sp.]